MTNARPSGRNPISQGISRPVATVATRDGSGRAAVATAGSGADLEHANLRRSATPTQVEQQRRRVVLVVELSQATFGVHAVHQHVTAGAQAGQRQVLALEVRLVVVSVPDRDALLDPEELRLAEATAARVDGAGRCARKAAPGGRVAIAEAETGLAIPYRRGAPAGPAQLVAVEAEQVPVAVVWRDDVAELSRSGDHLLRRSVALDHLVGVHRLGLESRPVPVDDQWAVAQVLDGGLEPEPVHGSRPCTRARDRQPRRRRLHQIRQALRSCRRHGRTSGDRQHEGRQRERESDRQDPEDKHSGHHCSRSPIGRSTVAARLAQTGLVPGVRRCSQGFSEVPGRVGRRA